MTKTCGIKFYEFCEPIPLITCLTNLTIVIQKIALAIFDCCCGKKTGQDDKDSPQIKASSYADYIRNKDTIDTVVRLIPLLSHFIVEPGSSETNPTKTTTTPLKQTNLIKQTNTNEIKKEENSTPTPKDSPKETTTPPKQTTPIKQTTENKQDKDTEETKDVNQPPLQPPKTENTNETKKTTTSGISKLQELGNKHKERKERLAKIILTTTTTTPTEKTPTTPLKKSEPLLPPLARLNRMINGGNTCYISSSLWALIHTDKESIEAIIRPFKETEEEFQLAFNLYKKGVHQKTEKKEPVGKSVTQPEPQHEELTFTDQVFDDLFSGTKTSNSKSSKPVNSIQSSTQDDGITLEEAFLISLENNEELQTKFGKHIEYKKTPQGKAFAAFVTLFNEITSEEAMTISGTTVNHFRQALRAFCPAHFSERSSSDQEDAYQFMQALHELLKIKNTLIMKETHKRKSEKISESSVDLIGVELSDPSNLQLNKEIDFTQIIKAQKEKTEELRKDLSRQLRELSLDNSIDEDLFDLSDLEQKIKMRAEFYKKNHIKARLALISLYEKYQNESFSHELPECMTLLKALKESYPKILEKLTISTLPSLINNALSELTETKQAFIFNLGEKPVTLSDGISTKTTEITDWKNELKQIELYKMERSYSIEKNTSRVCVQLKRYICNHKTQKTSKNTCNITIPDKITLKDNENQNVECSLSAVVVHSGATLGGGHYYTYLFKEGKVYLYNDTPNWSCGATREIKLEDARKDYEKNGYMVYYKPVK